MNTRSERHLQGGFNLIELLVTIVIVSILAAVAVPSYTSYAVRSHRTIAKAALSELAVRQEAFYADRKTYAATLTQLGLAADPAFLNSGKEYVPTATDALYQVSVSAASATGFTLTAAPLNSQLARDADCATLTLGAMGVRTASGPKGAGCWR